MFNRLRQFNDENQTAQVDLAAARMILDTLRDDLELFCVQNKVDCTGALTRFLARRDGPAYAFYVPITERIPQKIVETARGRSGIDELLSIRVKLYNATINEKTAMRMLRDALHEIKTQNETKYGYRDVQRLVQAYYEISCTTVRRAIELIELAKSMGIVWS